MNKEETIKNLKSSIYRLKISHVDNYVAVCTNDELDSLTSMLNDINLVIDQTVRNRELIKSVGIDKAFNEVEQREFDNNSSIKMRAKITATQSLINI